MGRGRKQNFLFCYTVVLLLWSFFFLLLLLLLSLSLLLVSVFVLVFFLVFFGGCAGIGCVGVVWRFLVAAHSGDGATRC